MSADKDLLIEIGTEELPPKALQRLSSAFAQGIVEGLSVAGFSFNQVQSFATPRRLAVLIKDVPASQPEQVIEKRGPALKAAYDDHGKPTKALEGFARSCGVSHDQLEKQETDKGAWMVFKAVESGKELVDLLPGIVEQSLSKLPIPKRMRWGDQDVEFVRPVHWAVLLHGSEIIKANILGVESSGETYGHRFHANAPLSLTGADSYEEQLRADGFVIAEIEERKRIIRQQVEAAAKKIKGHAVISDELLNEVAALVEWPVAIIGDFDKSFLEVPPEVLIKTMQDNQKYFAIVDDNKKLMPHFVTISNINSKTPEKIKEGNERVIRPRFADAAFFWDQDRKSPLDSFLDKLDDVVFQEKLGTLGDKTRRIVKLAETIADTLGIDKQPVSRAALLSKCDLMTDMVGEFPALQGVMGRYYAEACNEEEQVARAIEEQYWPRFSGDSVSGNRIGQIISISDRIDTLLGIFAVGLRPTGEKDPFGLRRASLGVLRTIIECKLDLDLNELISHAARQIAALNIDCKQAESEVFDYMIERLRAYYLDAGVTPDVFDAVSALKPSKPLDFDLRVKAVSAFRNLPEAESLAAANKRVGNILKKSSASNDIQVNESLLEDGAEVNLYNKLRELKPAVNKLFDNSDYEKGLLELASLRNTIDDFFDNVMVMVEDESVKTNRIALLNQMYALFLRAADLSRLHQDNN